jgi:hypothetical protein
MKKIRYLFLKIALFCTVIAQNVLSMNIATALAKGIIAGACSTAEVALVSMPAASSILFNPADLRAQKLQNAQSDAPKAITQLISQIASERGLSDLKVILHHTMHDYSTDDNGKILYVPTKKAIELEKLINNNDRNEIDQKRLNEHSATIHHELTHGANRSLKYVPMYESIIGTIGALASQTALTYTAKKYIPTIHKNFVLKNTFKLARGTVGLSVAFALINMNLYKKYDELKADDGIPHKKPLLEATAEKFEARHAEYLRSIDIIKERAQYKDIISPPEGNEFSRLQLLAMKTLPKHWFNKPLVMDCVFHATSEHPSDLRRALRLRYRIEHIENVKS